MRVKQQLTPAEIEDLAKELCRINGNLFRQRRFEDDTRTRWRQAAMNTEMDVARLLDRLLEDD